MNKKPILILLAICPLLFSGQVTNPDTSIAGRRFILFSASYRLPVNKSRILNSGHGIAIEAGINPARFFSGKTIIGLYAGWGWRDHLWSTSFDRQFVHDYQSTVITETLSARDSSIVHVSKELFREKKGASVPLPGCETNSFHNYSIYYGIILRLPRYSPVLKLYTGSVRAHYQGPGDLIEPQKEHTIVQLRRKMYGAEILLSDPLGFICRKKQYPSWLANLAFSFYYEQNDFSTAVLYFSDGEQELHIPLKRFTGSAFLNKYKKEQTFGFRFSYALL
jgi:hypothetical protein